MSMIVFERYGSGGRVNGSGPGRLAPRWREPGRVAGVAVSLLLVERLLVGEVGSPTALARTLQDLGDPAPTRSCPRSP